MGGSDGAPRIPPAVRVSNLPPKRRQSQCGRCGVEGRRESVERVRLYSKAVQMCSPKWDRSPSQHTHAHHRRHQASRAHTHVLGGVASSFRPHLHTVHRHVTRIVRAGTASACIAGRGAGAASLVAAPARWPDQMRSASASTAARNEHASASAEERGSLVPPVSRASKVQ